ncbi:MAG: hypothetical protein IIA83_06230 [Thaumarchaeota archaeon]|nr:hypothetical protein [Nitrososphaerota archaeon]
MNYGPIKKLEDFKKIQSNNLGIILITDSKTGNHLHLPSCSFVTESNYQQKVITDNKKFGDYSWWANVSMAEKKDPTAKLCTKCNPVLMEQQSALNESGTFLQISVFHKIIEAGWGAETEFPVSIAPFVSDPMKQDVAIKKTQQQGESMKIKTRSGGFQQAIVNSQSESLRKETSIDVLASASKDNFSYVLCTEVKKLNPYYVSWIFFQQNVLENNFRVLSKSTVGGGTLNLLSILESDLVDKKLFVQVEKFDKLKSFTPNIYDYGVTLTKDDKGNYKFQKSSLNKATTQVIEGTFGSIVDSVTNQVSTGAGYDYDAQYFIPIIVTNANILTCNYDVKDLDLNSGVISKIDLQPQDAVIYEYPFPMRVRFPNQVIGVSNDVQLRHSLRWPVLIVSPKGLGSFLTAINKDAII